LHFLDRFSKKKKNTNIKCHENPSSGRRVVPCGRTDGHDRAKAAFLNSAKAHKSEITSLSYTGIQTRLIHPPIKYQKRDYHTNEVGTDVIQLFDPQKLVSRIQPSCKTVVSRHPLTMKARVRPHASSTTKHWDRFLSKYFGLPPVSVIQQMLLIRISLNYHQRYVPLKT